MSHDSKTKLPSSYVLCSCMESCFVAPGRGLLTGKALLGKESWMRTVLRTPASVLYSCMESWLCDSWLRTSHWESLARQRIPVEDCAVDSCISTLVVLPVS